MQVEGCVEEKVGSERGVWRREGCVEEKVGGIGSGMYCTSVL